MNHSMISYILGFVLKFEAIFMLLPCLVAVIYREQTGFAYLIMFVFCFGMGHFFSHKKPENQIFYAKEGFIMVSLSWLVMSVFGALPFVITQEIPSFTDALFETISGFTTTGASILNDVEALSHCSLFWRSFTHWVGGMGVFVFILAVLPLAGGQNVHLLKSESPGPEVGKLVPRLRHTSAILYGIYFVMTVIEIILLLIAKMPLFDSITIAFGTAGTGGFGIRNDSIAEYNIHIQNIITVFMILFGVNFNAYYLLLKKKKANIFKLEEVRWYFGIIAASILLITFNIRNMVPNIGMAFQQAAFQVGSIITTTGYSTVDFNQWPELSKNILVLIMMIGACAGSTGGGIKVSRIIILFKNLKKELQRFIHPRSVKRIKMDGKVVEPPIVHGVTVFLIAYVIIYAVSCILISIDNFDLETNFTAVAATLNNIGPGLSKVGPTQNFSLFSPFSKYVLMFDMLAGRLELFPMLLLFSPSIWKER
ncbi:MAG: TrkH family potassium uptake protein [Clostridiales bacterium]|nr:TrkH family potassium uptake protein [Clostridiales bacterium]